jgi:hypothetical protein
MVFPNYPKSAAIIIDTTLRTARPSIKTHLKWLYTYEDCTELQIPNTTNLLEKFNAQLKRTLHNHYRLNKANHKKFIDGFINTKK